MMNHSVLEAGSFMFNRSGVAVLGLGAAGAILLLGAFIVGSGMLGLIMILGAMASLVLQVFFGIEYVATQQEEAITLANTQPAIHIEEQLLEEGDWEELMVV